jgi:hypothetical protein
MKRTYKFDRKSLHQWAKLIRTAVREEIKNPIDDYRHRPELLREHLKEDFTTFVVIPVVMLFIGLVLVGGLFLFCSLMGIPFINPGG